MSLRAGTVGADLDVAGGAGDHRIAALVVGLLLLGAAAALMAATAPPDATRSVPGTTITASPDRDFTAAEQSAGDALASRVRPWALSSIAVGLLVSLLLGFTPVGARLVRATGSALGAGEWGTLVAGTLLLLIIGRAATLPFAVMARRPQVDVGLSTQSWSAWALDAAKSFGLTAMLVLTAVCVLRLITRASPEWWWAWAAALAGGAVVLLSFLVPVVVEPLFNRFTPMPDSPLRSSLIAVAEDEGVAVDEVLVADASRRTTALNAYVSGLGSTRRIVVYDTLLAEASPDEVRSVVAHELGHAAENDVRDATILGALAVSGAVALLGFLMTWPALLRQADVASVRDPGSVALLLALVSLLAFVAGPVGNAASRRVEARADIRALEATRDPLALAQVQRRLALTNRSDLTPPSLLFAWFGTHPTAAQRIAVARAWASANDETAVPDLAGRPLPAATEAR